MCGRRETRRLRESASSRLPGTTRPALILAVAIAQGVVVAPADTIGASSGAGPTNAPAPVTPRTVVAVVEVDRAAARLVSFTVKDRPFAAPRVPALLRPADEGPAAQAEIVLRDADHDRLLLRKEIPGLCLAHDPDTPPHVEEDTIRLHRETFLVELPELAGADRIEIALGRRAGGTVERVPVGSDRLSAERFVRTTGSIAYADLAFAPAREAGAEALHPDAAGAEASYQPQDTTASSGQVHWPEEYGDPDRYTVWGDVGEFGKRINVVLVPDGYTHAEKSTMRAHAQALVDDLRSRTPFAQHDRFLNYILVYAYSNQSGTDQCDCGTVSDTAVGTAFPADGDVCGGAGNRCLYYASVDTCDVASAVNIALAEARAPAHDTTIVMVNSARQGGCAGARTVYAAAGAGATATAAHELGHSFAGLDDEYGGAPACGAPACGVNTSLDGIEGSWPEWIADLGAPRAGGKYYDQCVYRPAGSCLMRSLSQPLCPVCTQHWSLGILGHSRVVGTAPIAARLPGERVDLTAGGTQTFTVVTRLPSGTGVSNGLTWRLQSPGETQSVVVASGVNQLTRTFTSPGAYTLTCEVVAGTNFIKPSKTGANADTTTWSIHVAGPQRALRPPNLPTRWSVSPSP
jgi:IgA peptidase M64